MWHVFSSPQKNVKYPMLQNVAYTLFQRKKTIFDIQPEEFALGVCSPEYKYLGIVYVNYCCTFMAKKKSVGDN